MRTMRNFQAGCLLALLVLAGCAEQHEGERCDRSNADLDCEIGLRCTPLDIGAICCPDTRPATVDACRTANLGGGGTGGTSTGGTSSGGTSSGGTSSGGSESGGTGGTSTDASTGLPPDAGIDGTP
jgi:uncharacterized membrane protein YgcG